MSNLSILFNFFQMRYISKIIDLFQLNNIVNRFIMAEFKRIVYSIIMFFIFISLVNGQTIDKQKIIIYYFADESSLQNYRYYSYIIAFLQSRDGHLRMPRSMVLPHHSYDSMDNKLSAMGR